MYTINSDEIGARKANLYKYPIVLMYNDLHPCVNINCILGILYKTAEGIRERINCISIYIVYMT